MFEKIYKYLIIGLLFFHGGTEMLSQTYKKLSEQAQISILIGEPSDTDLFSIFGHMAIRIRDPELSIDYIFNYGVPRLFTAGVVNFFRLFKEKFPNELYAVSFTEFEKEYLLDRRSLYELLLNLSQEEMESIWQSLLTIAQSGKRISYYDLFKHNCTALPLALVENNTSGTIRFSVQDPDESYRSFVNQYVKMYPWFHFYVSLSLGWKVDRPISYRESFFLPRNVKEGLLSAIVIDDSGNEKSLITNSQFLVFPEDKQVVSPVFTPAFFAWLLLAVVILLCIFELRNKCLLRWIDAILFTVAGITGCYLFYIQFIFTLWYTFPSWWLLWLNPLQLLGAIFSATKRFDRLAVCYHIFNIVTIVVMLIVTCFVSQYYHPAFAPLILLLVLRSLIRITHGRLIKKIIRVY